VVELCDSFASRLPATTSATIILKTNANCGNRCTIAKKFPGTTFNRKEYNAVANLVHSTVSRSRLKRTHFYAGGVPCTTSLTTTPAFEPMSKRRRGYPSETRVKAGVRFVHSHKLLEEKLGRNDLCPCGSGLRFKRCCIRTGRF
jgi:hypothetical protein